MAHHKVCAGGSWDVANGVWYARPDLFSDYPVRGVDTVGADGTGPAVVLLTVDDATLTLMDTNGVTIFWSEEVIDV